MDKGVYHYLQLSNLDLYHAIANTSLSWPVEREEEMTTIFKGERQRVLLENSQPDGF